jgi:Family of unknown function (DUF6580)
MPLHLFVYATCFVAFRLIPHPANLSPLISMALFSGLMIKNKTQRIVFPISCLLISDYLLGFYSSMAFTYLPVLLTIAIGSVFKHKLSYLKMINASLISALSFFILSNFGVWLLGALYPHDILGLMACFIAAIPFFKNTLFSTLLFSTIFWLVYLGVGWLKYNSEQQSQTTS